MIQLDFKKWGVALLTSFILCVIVSKLVLPWRTDIWNDVPVYYGAERAAQTPAQLPAVITAPFFRVHSANGISAPESKPVYMAVLNVWCTFYRWLHTGHENSESQRNELFFFTLLTFGMLALVLIATLWRLGAFYSGVLSSVLVLLSSWSLVYLYYPAYLQFSIVLFLFSFMRLMAHDDAAPFQSGLLSALALLANNSMIIYVMGLALLVVLRGFPRARESLQTLLSFLKGVAIVFVFFEIINSIGVAERLTGSSNLDSPLRIFINYYKRSMNANHFLVRGLAEVPKQPFMLFTILRYQSWTLFALFAILPLAFAACVLRKGWRLGFRIPELRQVAALWLPAFIGIIFMDFYPGIVQLGRAYFVGYVLFILGGVLFWKYLQTQFRPLRWVGILLLALYFGEAAKGLAEEDQAFHGLIYAVHPDAAHPFAVLSGDQHISSIQHTLGEKISPKLISVKAVGDLSSLAEKHGKIDLLVGPEIETILFNGWAGPYRPIESGTLAVRKGLRVKVGMPNKIPYYGLYPPLIFEDEFDTWRFVGMKAFGAVDYKNGVGAITQWPVVLERVADDDDMTALIENITASSTLGGFEPKLLVDEGPLDVHAWHSHPQPEYPVKINVTFRQKVALEQLGFQAQWGTVGNLQRSPREVKVFGGRDWHSLTELASLSFDFPASGYWCFRNIPKKTQPFRFYQLVIANNHGNKDFTSLQELKFYGQIKPPLLKDKDV